MKIFLQWVIVIGFLAVLAFLLVDRKVPQRIVEEQKEDPKIIATGLNQVKIAGQTLDVELALTVAEQNQGLSGRKELKENEAMLFVFDAPGRYSFWMKDMNFPIDMIWIAEENLGDLRVVYIKKNAEPDSYPNSFGPKKDAQYVLETVSGFSEKHGLKEGDPVEFNF